jgi:hypothetical protein
MEAGYSRFVMIMTLVLSSGCNGKEVKVYWFGMQPNQKPADIYTAGPSWAYPDERHTRIENEAYLESINKDRRCEDKQKYN